jgi:hypothetical protein
MEQTCQVEAFKAALWPSDIIPGHLLVISFFFLSFSFLLLSSHPGVQIPATMLGENAETFQTDVGTKKKRKWENLNHIYASVSFAHNNATIMDPSFWKRHPG